MKAHTWFMIALVAVLSFAVLPSLVNADTIQDLLNQISALQAQVAQLQVANQGQADVGGTTPTLPSAAIANSQWCHTFTANLGYKSTGNELSALHQALLLQGISYPMDENDTYGDTTALAVSTFQEKYTQDILDPKGLAHGTGYVGASTRAKLNQLFGCTNSGTSGTNSATSITSNTTDQTSTSTSNANTFPGIPQNILDLLQSLKAHPPIHIITHGVSIPASPFGSPAPGGGFSPSQIRHAYGFDQITFSNGAIQGDGTGQTIAIIDAYDDPNISSDLAFFDSYFGIPAAPSFKKVNQTGGTSYPTGDGGWALEISLDVEWVHAIAPGANILLVEANSNSSLDLLTGLSYAISQPGVSVVSLSWGAPEFSTENQLDSHFTTPSGHNGITFVASSSDGGSSGGPSWPTVSPNVLGVGGTNLTLDWSSGNYSSETGWSGSGGGISAYEKQPGYQNGVVTQSSAYRTTPDVSYNAGYGFGVYDTYGYSGWLDVGGTSAGAPQWAALVAIANQGRSLSGLTSLDGLNQALPMLYQMQQSNYHDILTGNNGAYSAGPGYDLVTGRGTPLALSIVNGLTGSSDTTPPTTSITAPANGATISGTTSVTASASDNVGVTKVEFYLDNVLASTSTVSPYSWSWNTTTATNASHTLYTKAYDAAGNVGISSTITVTVSNTTSDTTSPTIPTGLTSSSITNTSFTLSWTASTDPDDAVSSYTIYQNGTSIGTSTTTSMSVTGLTCGTTYSMTVSATDTHSNTSAQSAALSVTTIACADITPPTGSITSPANGSTVPKNGVKVTSSFTDVDDAVSSIGVYLNGSSTAVGTCTNTTGTTTFSCTVSVAAKKFKSGSNTISAKGTDTHGNVGLAASITVTK